MQDYAVNPILWQQVIYCFREIIWPLAPLEVSYSMLPALFGVDAGYSGSVKNSVSVLEEGRQRWWLCSCGHFSGQRSSFLSDSSGNLFNLLFFFPILLFQLFQVYLWGDFPDVRSFWFVESCLPEHTFCLPSYLRGLAENIFLVQKSEVFACYFIFLSLMICLFSYTVVSACIQWSEEFFICYVHLISYFSFQ